MPFWISDDGVARSARSVGTLVDGLLDGEAYYEEINPYPDIAKDVHYHTFSGGKYVLTRNEKLDNWWEMGYHIVTYANGEEFRYGLSTDDPDKWKDWCSNYQTGARSSHPIPEQERLWN